MQSYENREPKEVSRKVSEIKVEYKQFEQIH